ncbi:MAG: hypothetical protein JNN20_14745 [Betaproteobacteria bacterium]|nr:hypothetical protein [Betaproteobacteria bacterium]
MKPFDLSFIVVASLACCAPLMSHAAGRSPEPAKATGAPAPTLIDVVSRKTHGAAGVFDLTIDTGKAIGDAVTIEPREAGAGHVLVFRFNLPIASPGALSVVDDTGAAIGVGSAGASGNDVVVNLPAMSDNRRIRVSLANVNGAGVNVSTALGLLLGDSNNAGSLASSGLSAIKARAGQSVDGSNFQYDINLSGLVSAADIASVRARIGALLSPVSGASWPGFGRDTQHTGLSSVAAQSLDRIRWSTPVDLAPQYSGTLLFAHYGPPVITPRNTVLLPVKTGPSGGFRFEARSGANGSLLWTQSSDYILPAHNWVPSYNLAVTDGSRVYAPGAGGKLIYRDNADSLGSASQNVVFYGAAAYASAPATFDATVFINTPLTVDGQGNVFFGFAVTGANPANLSSGIARIAPNGTATWIGLAALLGTAYAQPMMNSAPALSANQGTLYVATRSSSMPGGAQTGHLLALNTTTLAIQSSVRLLDPVGGLDAIMTDNGTSSPTVGPDGDVYFGVLGSSGGGHSLSGWMLHFDGTLSVTKTPGAFGWDNTPSIVPASMVPSYAGPSSYLLMTKYNRYTDGQHRIAILDPNQTQVDPSGGSLVMKEILTVLSPTPYVPNPSRQTEWCINTAAIDPATNSVLVNNEDGYLYRWNLATNQLEQRIRLNGGLGQAYTATVIGPDGAVYAVNNAVLSSVSR